jgi:hypothetical protein
MKCTVEMVSGGMIYVSSFMEIGTHVEEILMFCLTDVKSCNVGTTDRRELWSMPLRWLHVA